MAEAALSIEEQAKAILAGDMEFPEADKPGDDVSAQAARILAGEEEFPGEGEVGDADEEASAMLRTTDSILRATTTGLDAVRQGAINLSVGDFSTPLVPEDPEERAGNRIPIETQRFGARIALEAGVAAGAVAATGGAAFPATITRFAPTAVTGLYNFGLRAAATTLGVTLADLGASFTFDPRDEPFKEAALTGAANLVGEGIGAAIIRGLSGATGRNLDIGVEEGIDLLQREGAALTAGQASTNRAVDLVEGAVAASFTGGRVLTARERSATVMRNVIKSFAEAFETAGSAEDAGKLVQAAIKGNADTFRSVGRGMFTQVDELTRGARVDARDTKALALKLVEDFRRGGVVSDEATSVLQQILKKDDFLSFSDAQRMRSDLLGISRSGSEVVAGQAEGIAKRLAATVDGAMEKSAKELDGPGLEAFRNANAFWRSGKDAFNSQVIKGIANTRHAEKVLDQVLAAGGTSKIREIRELIGDELIWSNVQGAQMQRFITSASDSAGSQRQFQTLSGERFLQAIKSLGEETADAIFSPAQRKQLQKFGETLRRAEGDVGAGNNARIFVQLGQAGVFAGFAMAPNENTAKAALLAFAGPAVAARVLTNPKFIRWATVGLRSKPLKSAGSVASPVPGAAPLSAATIGAGSNVPLRGANDQLIRAVSQIASIVASENMREQERLAR